MPILPIAENGHALQAPQLNYATGQVLTASGTSSQSSAITGEAIYIAAIDADIYFAEGSNPTAVTNGASALLPKGSYGVFKITSGNKIAVIRAGSTSATVNIIPIV